MPLTYGAESALKEPRMQIETTHLGILEVAEGQLLEFPEGLIGLPDLRRFALVEDEERAPFQWLQSLDDPSLAFVVIEPKWMVPDIEIEIADDAARLIEISRPEEAAALAIVTIPEEASQMTANLKGPIVFGLKSRRAAQIVLEDLPLQFRILPGPE